MKTLPLFILSLVSLFTISSCVKTPEASISADKTTAAVNETITVNSTSKNTNTYSWSVWDGTSTTGGSSTSRLVPVSGGGLCDNSFSFKLDSVGTYTVLLRARNDKDGCTATNSSGKSDEATVTLTIQ